MKIARTILILAAGFAACAGVPRSAGAAAARAVGALNAARPDEGAEYKKLIDDYSAALVTVKFVLKMEGNDFGMGENETEITGAVIDPAGIVLCSNVQIGGFMQMMGKGSANPTDMKVLIGDDTEGKKAKLMARDSELDLAWIKIEEPLSSPLKFIDFSKSAAPDVGARLLSVGRMGKYFDRTPVVSEGRITGVTRKPRHLLVPGNTLVNEYDFGLPVFAADGGVVGVVIVQIPDAESSEGGGMGGRGGGAMILPAEDVVKATKRAMESPSLETPKKDDKAADPKDSAKKPAGTKDTDKKEPPR
jgi:S1-C subfamily serine protease